MLDGSSRGRLDGAPAPRCFFQLTWGEANAEQLGRERCPIATFEARPWPARARAWPLRTVSGVTSVRRAAAFHEGSRSPVTPKRFPGRSKSRAFEVGVRSVGRLKAGSFKEGRRGAARSKPRVPPARIGKRGTIACSTRVERATITVPGGSELNARGSWTPRPNPAWVLLAIRPRDVRLDAFASKSRWRATHGGMPARLTRRNEHLHPPKSSRHAAPPYASRLDRRQQRRRPRAPPA